jgi:hypothetical protein
VTEQSQDGVETVSEIVPRCRVETALVFAVVPGRTTGADDLEVLAGRVVLGRRERPVVGDRLRGLDRDRVEGRLELLGEGCVDRADDGLLGQRRGVRGRRGRGRCGRGRCGRGRRGRGRRAGGTRGSVVARVVAARGDRDRRPGSGEREQDGRCDQPALPRPPLGPRAGGGSRRCAQEGIPERAEVGDQRLPRRLGRDGRLAGEPLLGRVDPLGRGQRAGHELHAREQEQQPASKAFETLELLLDLGP